MACRLLLSKPLLGCCNWNLRNKLQWNFIRNTKLFIHENASENIVCEMAAILSRGRDELTTYALSVLGNGNKNVFIYTEINLARHISKLQTSLVGWFCVRTISNMSCFDLAIRHLQWCVNDDVWTGMTYSAYETERFVVLVPVDFTHVIRECFSGICVTGAIIPSTRAREASS